MKKIWLEKKHIAALLFILFIVLEVTKVTTLSSLLLNKYLEAYTEFNVEQKKRDVLSIFSKEIQHFLLSETDTSNPSSSKEIRKLKNQIEILNEDLVIQKYLAQETFFLKQENNALRRQLNYKKKSEYKVLPAEITLIDPQNHFISFWISKGERQGVKTGQPVIAYQGQNRSLVGVISEVYKNTSLIRTIRDQQVHVGVVIGDTTSKAIVKGQSRFNPYLKMEYLDINLTNLINQPVYTSGLGQHYPTGIRVGMIKEVFEKNYGFFKSASVKPTTNFFTLRHVLIILQSPKSSPTKK